MADESRIREQVVARKEQRAAR
jgi:hypothetical protein